MKNKHELETLAKYLEEYEKHKTDEYIFDISVWRATRACGTAACAIGHLPLACPDTGISFRQGTYDSVVPEYGGVFDFAAVEAYFELSESDVLWAFDVSDYFDVFDIPSSEVTPTMVASRIRVLLSNKT